MLRIPSVRQLTKHTKHCALRTSTCRSISSIRAEVHAPSPPEKLCPSMRPFRTESADDGYVWTSRYGQINVPNATVDEYIWKNVAKWHDRIAVVCGVTGRQYSYGKLRDHCAAVAYRLRHDFGLNAGDVVAVSMANVPEYAIVILGAFEAGLTVTPINPSYTAVEQARQLKLTNTKLIFSLVDNVSTLLEAASINNSNYPVIGVKAVERQSIPDGVLDFEQLMNAAGVDYSKSDSKSHSPQDICLLPFSSGTSGLPKGAQISHNNLTSGMEMFHTPNPDHSIILPTTNDFQDVVTCVLPFFHIYGFSNLLKLALGCKLVTLPRFHPGTYLAAIAKHKATYLPMVPPIMQFLTNDNRCTSQHLASVRSILMGGAPLGEESIDRFTSIKGPNVEILNAFGMTETSVAVFMSHRLHINHASIGWPSASTQVKIVHLDDPSNRGLAANVSGELMIRSPSIMVGYLNNSKETATALTADGWLHTADIGSYDNNGDFYITDRAKDLIKVQAFQVAPAELEEILRSHPQVLDAAVIGVKHSQLGEAPKAFVVRKKDAKLTADEIHEFIAQRCIKYKWLVGGVQFIDAIPKNSAGKILKRELVIL